MTIFAAIRALTYLTRDAYLAAASLLRGPGLPGYDDDADLLAEREAAEDVTEPVTHYCEPFENDCDCGLGGAYDDDPMVPDSIFRSSGQTKEFGPRPRIATARPRPSGTRQRPTEEQHLDNIWHRLGTLIEAVERQTTLLEDIRNLLQHNGGRGDGKDVGERAESSSGASGYQSPASPHHAPVASASPQTPADATGSDPTLANDPASVQRRHMRRLLGEDK